jgi:hypothetical protein
VQRERRNPVGFGAPDFQHAHLYSPSFVLFVFYSARLTYFLSAAAGHDLGFTTESVSAMMIPKGQLAVNN